MALIALPLADSGATAGVIVLAAIALVALIMLFKAVRIVPQARAGIVERLGRYDRTLEPGLTLVMPFIDRVLPLIDLREQVVSFQPQAVITSDNVNVQVDSVLYYTVINPKDVTYEVANPIQAIEQLTLTTLRNIVGGIDLEQALTSRDTINSQLRTVLDEATGRWGIRVNRVELKAIDPPPTIQEAMEKQMRAERDKRATVLTAEGTKQSEILTAEGEQRAAILRAEGLRQSTILEAEGQREAQIQRAVGEAQAITTVFGAIHEGKPDRELLTYQYLQQLPRIAAGQASKLWIIPNELVQAIDRIGSSVPGSEGEPREGGPPDGGAR
jgi:regulator of protease activity HflC (stomatin/prohibitin superfamily)